MSKPNNRVKWGNFILGTESGEISVGLQPSAFICFCLIRMLYFISQYIPTSEPKVTFTFLFVLLVYFNCNRAEALNLLSSLKNTKEVTYIIKYLRNYL